jgi:hypothetical protein
MFTPFTGFQEIYMRTLFTFCFIGPHIIATWQLLPATQKQWIELETNYKVKIQIPPPFEPLVRSLWMNVFVLRCASILAVDKYCKVNHSDSFHIHLIHFRVSRRELAARIYIYRVSQEECVILREGVPYVKIYRYSPKHLCPKLNGYGENGQRKVWSSCDSTHYT